MSSIKKDCGKDTDTLAPADKKLKIAVLGGDARETPLIAALLKEYRVAAFARPPHLVPEGAIFCETIAEALYGAAGIILPMPGLKNDGKLFCGDYADIRLFEEDFSPLLPGTPVLVGAASEYLRRICDKGRLNLLPLVEKDEIAIPNAIPTAEGAISLAIANSPGTLAGSVSLILGYGRVGQALAGRIRCLGSRVIIANRGEARTRLAEGQGFEVVSWEEWPELCPEADYVFNTVPIPLLTADVLEQMKKTALILDLSSSPGGTDFAAAKELGIKAILAAGLPGRYAPLTAGKILVDVYPCILKEQIDANRRKDK